MELSMLDAKGVRNGIKRGMSIEDFCTKYSCTPNELAVWLGRLYSHNEQEVKNRMARMNSNAKKAKKKVTDEATEIVVTTVNVDTEIVTDEIIAEETPKYKTDEGANISSISEVEAQRIDELANLHKAETDQSKNVMDLETDHKALANQRKACKERLREIVAEAEQIKASYEQKYSEFEDIANKYNELGVQMNEISTKRSEKLVALDGIRQKIDELSKITVFVYADGAIAISDSVVIVPEDTDNKNLYDELLGKPECEELKLREIKTLAKMVSIKNSSSLSVEMVCDSEILEEVYRQIISVT